MNKFASSVLCIDSAKAVDIFKARLDGVPFILSADDMRYPSGGYEFVCIYNSREYGLTRIYHSSLGSALDTLESKKHKIKSGAVYVNGCIWVFYAPSYSSEISFLLYRSSKGLKGPMHLNCFESPFLYERLGGIRETD